MHMSNIRRIAVGVAVAALLGATLLYTGGAELASAKPAQHAKQAGPQHIFLIMMENHGFNEIIGNRKDAPYINWLAAHNPMATNYFGVTHVSLPNYIAATSGSTWGSNSDDVAQAPLFDHTNLVDQLESAGASWKAYMEDLPSPGSLVNQSSDGLYVRKHDPFLMYPDVYGNAARANKVVPLSQLSTDLSNGNVPQFVWITPNVCNDMHGGIYTHVNGHPETPCPYANTPTDANQAALYKNGDTFLQTWVTAIMNSKAWTGNSAIFVTWDEGSYADTAPYQPLDNSGCCDSPILPATPADPSTGGGGDLAGGTVYGGGQVPMIVVARHGARGTTDNTPTNHYSLLQTIEQNWNLPYLGNASDTVNVHSLAPLLKH